MRAQLGWKPTFVVFAAMIVALSGNTRAESTSAIEAELTRLLSSLRTSELKQQATQFGRGLSAEDEESFRHAVDFFHDLKAKEILVQALRAPSRNFERKIYVVDALNQLAQPGEVALAEKLLVALKETDVLMTGGSEVQIPRAKYQVALVKLLEKITGESLPNAAKPQPK